MKTYVDFWDKLFGKRVSFDLPMPDGSVKKMRVTMKWLEKIQKQRLMKDVTSEMVKVNILDPTGGISQENYEDPTQFIESLLEQKEIQRVEYWRIGDRVTQEQYDNFLDSETGELYAITTYEDGKPRTFITQRSMWEQAREEMRNV